MKIIKIRKYEVILKIKKYFVKIKKIRIKMP